MERQEHLNKHTRKLGDTNGHNFIAHASKTDALKLKHERNLGTNVQGSRKHIDP